MLFAAQPFKPFHLAGTSCEQRWQREPLAEAVAISGGRFQRGWDDGGSECAAVEIAERYLQWGVTRVHLMATGPSLDKALSTLSTLSATQTQLSWTVYGRGYPPELDRIWSEVSAAKAPADAFRSLKLRGGACARSVKTRLRLKRVCGRSPLFVPQLNDRAGQLLW